MYAICTVKFNHNLFNRNAELSEHLKIGFNNIGGLKNNLNNIDFVNFLNNFQIIGFAETLIDEKSSFQVEGFDIIIKRQLKKAKEAEIRVGWQYLLKKVWD